MNVLHVCEAAVAPNAAEPRFGLPGTYRGPMMQVYGEQLRQRFGLPRRPKTDACRRQVQGGARRRLDVRGGWIELAQRPVATGA